MMAQSRTTHFLQFIKEVKSHADQIKTEFQGSKVSTNGTINLLAKDNGFDDQKSNLSVLIQAFHDTIDNMKRKTKPQLIKVSSAVYSALEAVVENQNSFSKALDNLRAPFSDDEKYTAIIKSVIKHTPDLIAFKKDENEKKVRSAQKTPLLLTSDQVYSFLTKISDYAEDTTIKPTHRYTYALLYLMLNAGCRNMEGIYSSAEYIDDDHVKFSHLLKQDKKSDDANIKPIRPVIEKGSAKKTIAMMKETKQFWRSTYLKGKFFDDTQKNRKKMTEYTNRLMNASVRYVIESDSMNKIRAYSLRKIYVAMAFYLFSVNHEKESQFIQRTLGHKFLETSANYNTVTIVDDKNLVVERPDKQSLTLSEAQLKDEIKQEVKTLIKDVVQEPGILTVRQNQFYEADQAFLDKNGAIMTYAQAVTAGFGRSTVAAVRAMYNSNPDKFKPTKKVEEKEEKKDEKESESPAPEEKKEVKVAQTEIELSPSQSKLYEFSRKFYMKNGRIPETYGEIKKVVGFSTYYAVRKLFEDYPGLIKAFKKEKAELDKKKESK